MQEQEKFLTLDEVAKFIGVKKPTLYFYIKRLGIKTRRFNLDKRAYMTQTDAEKIKKVKEEPWTAGEREEKQGENSAA